ncbi:ABC transporter permease [Sinomonas sp. G460-2]|uniref:ABC transporter permease n=1 Tax=Sinomonas sp. G460-2 TaxID=3393464 RepID=UPI0039EE60E2
MTRVILHRLAVAIPVLFLMSIFTFVLVSFLPGDAAKALLGENATPQQIEQLRQQMGLNRPLAEQYLAWLGSAMHGDFGSSLLNGQPVVEILNTRLPVTLGLILATTVVTSVVGVVLGFASALRGGWLGRLVDLLAFVSFASPPFWIALLLITLFSVEWHVLPPNGFVPLAESPLGWVQTMLLPIVALATGGFAGIATQTRDSTMDALGRDFVRVLFANGLTRRSIAWKHVLRSSAPAVLTVIGLIFVSLLSGAVLIEQVFALPGVGQEVVTATTNHDIPVIQGAVLYLTAIVLIVNLVVDIMYGFVDPRVRVR